jgi:cyclase
MLSRNFRLQRVGDLQWLQKNYNFSNISSFIDELIILDVSREERNLDKFCEHVRALAKGCFIPIAAGGGICSIQQARVLLRSGADKIVVNSLLADNPNEILDLVKHLGSQCIIVSLDIKRIEDKFTVFTHNGAKRQKKLLKEYLQNIIELPIGEIYLNSIDCDGTGHGYLMDMLNYLPNLTPVPVILAGGAGKPSHLAEGLKESCVDAVATAHLFNFMGNGLKLARQELIEQGYKLPIWN